MNTKALVEDRGGDYAHPSINHALTAEFFSGWLNRRHKIALKLTAEDVCMLNILQKCSRLAHKTKDDSVQDLAGYSENIMMLKPEQRNGETAEPLTHAPKARMRKVTIYMAHAVRGINLRESYYEDYQVNLDRATLCVASLREILPNAEIWCPGEYEHIIGALYHQANEETDRTIIIKRIMAFSLAIVRLCDYFIYITPPEQSRGVAMELEEANRCGKICIPLYDVGEDQWGCLLRNEIDA